MASAVHNERIAAQPMRVTFALPVLRSRPIGGYRIVYEYACNLARRGHHVSLVHPRTAAHGRLTDGLLRRSEWKERLARRRGQETIPWFAFPPNVDVQIVKRLVPGALPEADVLFATAWRTADCVDAAPANKGRKFYLVQHHETWDAPESVINDTWRLPLHKIVISRWLADVARALGEADRTTYIPNAMDFAQFTLTMPQSARDPHSVAMLTHSKEWKGTSDGIAALERVRTAIPDLSVTLFGTGDRPPLAPPWMKYTRNVTGAALRDLYNDVAVFLHPSWAEGWPLPPAEAMACGCAVVATDNPGVLDYVTHEHTALVAPRRDPPALAAALIRILTDDELRASIAITGRDAILRYTWQRATDSLERLLDATAGATTYATH
jgi:glycosyltransferase involved in cell wall biosynthesis